MSGLWVWLTAGFKARAIALGFDLVGVAAVGSQGQPDRPESTQVQAGQALQAWLDQGYQAEMAWMADPRRQDIRQVLPGVRSLICVGLNYYTPQAHSSDPQCAKISRYGWGRDYHRVLGARLKALSREVAAIVPDSLALLRRTLRGRSLPVRSSQAGPNRDRPDHEQPDRADNPTKARTKALTNGLADLESLDSDMIAAWIAELEPWREAAIAPRWYVDTGPIQDKAWAQAAGLGWIAKNGNLISPQLGSWLFLGEVLTTLPLVADRPHTAHCGTCRRCLDACPTGAIVEPFVVDANRCLAYHTIENRAEALPTAIAENLQGWVAGCDICQDVCPWNQRFAQPTALPDFAPYPENIAPKLRDLAQISDAAWDQQFRASALRRITPAMVRRNARANLAAIAPKDQEPASPEPRSTEQPG